MYRAAEEAYALGGHCHRFADCVSNRFSIGEGIDKGRCEGVAGAFCINNGIVFHAFNDIPGAACIFYLIL